MVLASVTWCPEAYRVADPTSACFDPSLWVLAYASLLGAVLLSAAGVQDLVQRRAPNVYWVVMLVPAAATVFFVSPEALVSGMLGVGAAALLYYSGGFGGADAKAVAVSAALFPDPTLWLGLFACSIIGMGTGLALGLRRLPFLVPLAFGVGTGLFMTALSIFPVVYL